MGARATLALSARGRLRQRGGRGLDGPEVLGQAGLRVPAPGAGRERASNYNHNNYHHNNTTNNHNYNDYNNYHYNNTTNNYKNTYNNYNNYRNTTNNYNDSNNDNHHLTPATHCPRTPGWLGRVGR